MRQATLTLDAPLAALATANAAAVLTAWFGGWGLGELFRLYWIEVAVVGVVGLFQIRCARRPGPLAKSRGYQGIFFVAHYGTFCVAYGAMMASILRARWDVNAIFWLVVLLPAAALAAAHVIAFRVDFLRRQAAVVSSMQAMILPYARVIPVQAPIVLAAAILPADIPPQNAALLIALGKFAADLGLHLARNRIDHAGNPANRLQ